MRLAHALSIGCCLVVSVFGQPKTTLDSLIENPQVQAALEAIRREEPACLEDQIQLCEIPAPSFQEGMRAQEIKRRFEAMGLHDVRIDDAGNVIGVRPGKAAHPNLVLAAHLDTVFPEGTDVRVKREGAILRAPGIGDDARGLAVLLAVIRALNGSNLEMPGTITFVADTGEEGLGDLRGVKWLFGHSLKGQVDRFVSIDSPGLHLENVGVGSYRYRVTFEGLGGHSYAAFGLANPIHAMGRAIAKISQLRVPSQPKTTFNVGRVGGGASVNAIASEAWMEVDMRSANSKALGEVRDRIEQAIKDAVREENEFPGHRGEVTAALKLIGDRPAGNTSADTPMFQTALEVSRLCGKDIVVREGSSDSNLPMSLGIPALTIGGGGEGGGSHAPSEWFDATESWRGTQRAFLLVLALAQAD